MLWLLAAAMTSALVLVWGVCGIAGEQSRQEEREARLRAWRGLV